MSLLEQVDTDPDMGIKICENKYSQICPTSTKGKNSFAQIFVELQ